MLTAVLIYTYFSSECLKLFWCFVSSAVFLCTVVSPRVCAGMRNMQRSETHDKLSLEWFQTRWCRGLWQCRGVRAELWLCHTAEERLVPSLVLTGLQWVNFHLVGAASITNLSPFCHWKIVNFHGSVGVNVVWR